MISKEWLMRVVNGAIKSYRHEHGYSFPGGSHSLAKRVAGAVYGAIHNGDSTATESLKSEPAGEDRSQAAETAATRTEADRTQEVVEAMRVRAYRAMRLFEPSMEGYNAAVSVYEAAFGDQIATGNQASDGTSGSVPSEAP